MYRNLAVLFVSVLVGCNASVSEKPPSIPVPNGESSKPKSAVPSFGVLFSDGQTALDDGDNEIAIARLTKALELDPKSAAAFNARGVAYLRMDKRSLAIADFNRAIELVPNDAKFYANRALVWSEREEYHRALTDINKAIELEPRVAQWYRGRAKIHVFADENAAAEKDFAMAKVLEGGAAAPLEKNVPPVATREPKPKLTATDEDARRVLTTALDAWAFGDEKKQFDETHPEIQLFELDWLVNHYVLLKYEIAAARPYNTTSTDGKPIHGISFAVILTHPTNVGQERKQKKNYTVYFPNDDLVWRIMGLQQ